MAFPRAFRSCSFRGDGNGLVRDILAVVGGEHGDDPAVVFGFTHAPERNSPDHSIFPFDGLLALRKDRRHHGVLVGPDKRR